MNWYDFIPITSEEDIVSIFSIFYTCAIVGYKYLHGKYRPKITRYKIGHVQYNGMFCIHFSKYCLRES